MIEKLRRMIWALKWALAEERCYEEGEYDDYTATGFCSGMSGYDCAGCPHFVNLKIS
jgi:hypothetical protein